VLLSDIQLEIFNKVDAGVTAGLIPKVAFPHEPISFDKSVENFWARLFIAPNDVTDTWCGESRTGNILFNVYAKKETPIIEATKEAEKIVALFEEGLNLNGVRITDTGSIRQDVPNEETQGYFIPIVIKYEA